MSGLAQRLEQFGADVASVRSFDVEGPELLPYATLLSARQTDPDLSAIDGVYEWHNDPLLFLVDADRVRDGRFNRIRRLLAMRGDAPYLGLAAPGRLAVYRLSLDDAPADEARVELRVPPGQEFATLVHLANARPGAGTDSHHWISRVVLKLLTTSIDGLKSLNLNSGDAISLVGRALFTRFLGDRKLLSPSKFPDQGASAFDDAKRTGETSAWLDHTFNGDFLPLKARTIEKLPAAAFKILGDILRRAVGGQLSLGWEERWDRLDFAHIPVGVLSHAYQHYLAEHAPAQQRREGGYYTPRPIAELVTRAAFGALERDAQAHKSRILDPASGAGVFLLTAFRELVAQRWRHDQVRPDTVTLRQILHEQITGFDSNEAALRFAALGLYLLSIELDPSPTPPRKLRFKALRGSVLCKVATGGNNVGSLGKEITSEHAGRYDIVLGNPPWTTSTGLAGWSEVQNTVAQIAHARGQVKVPPLPNEALDLPFLWRAMEWAKPGGQIALALHGRLLFQQGDGMPEARRAVFRALDIRAIINGAELRQTNVWPDITAPFCLLFACNQLPPTGSSFRFVTPRLESSLNEAGAMRVDATNADLIRSDDVIRTPYLLKLFFRGTRADLQIFDRIESLGFPSLEAHWQAMFASHPDSSRFSGNGYQKLRPSSPIGSDGLRGIPATDLGDLPELTPEAMRDLIIDPSRLRPFTLTRLHRRRARSIYEGPLLIMRKSPPAAVGRIQVAVSQTGVIFNETYYGYSARTHPRGAHLVRYLALLLSSKVALWFALMTSGEFGFERDVVEKATIDKLFIPPFDQLTESDADHAYELFETVAVTKSEGAWNAVDAFVANQYRLRERDLQVISDTLSFNLPFAKNRKQAQQPPSAMAVEMFNRALHGELQPWAERIGQNVSVALDAPVPLSPWQGVRISLRQPAPQQNDSASVTGDWMALLLLADQLAATEVIYADAPHHYLLLGRLKLARYWSQTEARLAAQRIIWDHVDLLTRREGAQ